MALEHIIRSNAPSGKVAVSTSWTKNCMPMSAFAAFSLACTPHYELDVMASVHHSASWQKHSGVALKTCLLWAFMGITRAPTFAYET